MAARPLSVPLLLVAIGCADGPTGTDNTPPGPIASLAATASGGTVRLSWSEPADRDVASTLLVRFPAEGADAGPDPGRSYSAGEVVGRGVAVFSGRGTQATDSPPCQEQLYAAWARDQAGNWSTTPQTVRVAGLPGSPLPAGLATLSATVDGAGIGLSWVPGGNTPASIRVVRKRGSAPVDPADGEVVFGGTGLSARDGNAELSPLVTWHYAAFACNPCGECERAGARTSVTATLVQSLRVGGFVIYWRHAHANVCEDLAERGGSASAPIVAEWWMSCERDCARATARQLSQLGHAQADSLGAALRSRGIPITKVISSEYCRARETAARMALGPPTETLKEVTFFVYPELDLCRELQALVAQRPLSGNTAIVGHLFRPCLDDTFGMGDADVYRADGRGGATFVTRVRVSEWGTLP